MSDKRRAYSSEYAKRPHVRNKALAKYGITHEQYDALYVRQHGQCAACFVPQHDLRIRFAVDHCHTTGRVRGLLCTRCNRMAGLIENNLELVDHLLDYLKRT